MKRQRGRGRKPGGGGHHNSHQGGGHQHPNRTMESNGPDVKVRGPAPVIYERYLQLARDASSSGDRVMAENYQQHAEHYYRLWRQLQPALPPPSPERFNDQEFEGDEEGGPEGEGAEGEMAAEGGDQPDVEFPREQRPPRQEGQGGQGEGHERGGDDGFRRRGRGRRNRYRGEGEGAEAREGGGDRPPRREEGGEDRGPRREAREGGDERPERPRREPRERDENAGPEGFSSGPKPAFLRSE